FRQRVGHFPIAIEPFARGLGHTVAQFVTQLGALQLALLAQLFQSCGIDHELINRRQRRRRRCFRLTAGRKGQDTEKRHNFLHGSISSLVLVWLAIWTSSEESMVCTRSMKRASVADGSRDE